MGCGWSQYGRLSNNSWFQRAGEEEEQQLDEVSGTLKIIDDQIKTLRLRHDHYYKQIREPRASRKMQQLLLYYMKKNNGLQLTLVNIRLSIEQGAITADVVNVLRHSRNTLVHLSRKANHNDLYNLIDEIKVASDELNDAADSMADLNECNEEELEQELRQLLQEPLEWTPEPILPPTPTSNPHKAKQLVPA